MPCVVRVYAKEVQLTDYSTYIDPIELWHPARQRKQYVTVSRVACDGEQHAVQLVYCCNV